MKMTGAGVIKELLPKDGFCVVAITARDIYEHPRDDGEIVLGRGTGDRVGLVPPRQAAGRGVKQKKEEEMCHIFGIDHCVYYTCLMNAHASPDGQDHAEALHLCPIDLRKLSHCIGFDVGERYRQLATYYDKERWKEEAEWMERRIKHLPTPPATIATTSDTVALPPSAPSAPPARGQEAKEEDEEARGCDIADSTCRAGP
ncbi:archeobacterial metalloproteinaselike 2, putative [Acanthamoeba castellanii str. Neff]|uniref:Archeobacterial metalloproteinaselike 2, putative n=1 Tax=Acanthamoeba castellanii (strain ATCC 30010 / Neff) TaxID=1257118 RepID=L8HM98_ACACF|nr:archeobacterial metalloproteinaselike 2, putative [Acanthamoeba castellanii str. Neff]ELR25516.1 archeobacterial metalloproteinaselike 2, putative [Acanthamoeba castellanii str. Neff]